MAVSHLYAIFAKLAAGELSESDAEAAFDTATEQARLLRVHAGVQARAAEAHRASVQRSRDRLAGQLYAEACAEAEAAAGPVEAESTTIKKAVATIVGHSAKLRRARSALQEAVDAAYRLRPDGAPEPHVVDEPEWAGVDEALELLQEGPARPAAAAKRRAEKAQAAKERSDRELFATYATQYGGRLIGEAKLRQALPLEGELLERTVTAVKAEWDKRLAEQTPERRAALLAERKALDREREQPKAGVL